MDRHETLAYTVTGPLGHTVAGPLRLSLAHYETVVAIVEFGTMTEAARNLGVGQSALSHRLAEAERRLGVPLFARTADRRLTPTGAGLSLYQAAGRALRELRRVEEDVATAEPDVEMTLRLGVGAYESYGWFPGFLADLQVVRPEIDLDLLSVPDRVGAALADRSIDLAVAPGSPEGDHRLLTGFDDELVLVCASDHPLGTRESVEAVDLVDETLLTYNASPSPGFEYDRFVRPSGLAPRIVRVVRHTSAIIELVAAGRGVSILSRWATAPAVESGRLRAVRCGAEGLVIPWHIVVRPNDPVPTQVAGHLADYFAQDGRPHV